jgi:hypothetical protein
VSAANAKEVRVVAVTAAGLNRKAPERFPRAAEGHRIGGLAD